METKEGGMKKWTSANFVSQRVSFVKSVKSFIEKICMNEF